MDSKRKNYSAATRLPSGSARTYGNKDVWLTRCCGYNLIMKPLGFVWIYAEKGVQALDPSESRAEAEEDI